MNNIELLVKSLEEIQVKADDAAIEKLLTYKEKLVEWNEKINLTTIIEEKDVFIKHFVDSATCITTGYIKEGAHMIDVGTGAGFPGVPIKILREDVHITLLDSLNKRINYLKDVVDTLGLKGVEMVHARAEEGGSSKDHREKYDIVLSRAVATLNVLCEYCLPFAKVGGFFICQKGPSYGEEINEAQKAIEILGGKVREVKTYHLPYSDITHYIIIIEKVRETPTKYPRKPGKPASNPIV